MKRICFLILAFGTVPLHATTLESYWYNTEGVLKFLQKSYYPAYQKFLKALEQDPFNPEVQMNLGLTFEANEENEKAEKAYRGALNFIAADDPLRFTALFNLAEVLGKQSKIEEALATYQEALRLRPDSVEVKTNIELLWQQSGGGGQGNNQDKNNQKNQDKQKQKGGEGDDKDKNQKQNSRDNQNQDQQKEKKQPKPFDSKELSPEDVKKILDEIKNQEQSIRANEYEHNVKEAPRGKDW